ncbi:hypothetical protein FC19_GL002031 [Liquorilactobacillus aquaticus DSM 21051]|uniref:Reverse transcriptase domain-containing protein n=1 Tax=Liquorilactobacillus aquaticus DSM 21051 TaxID=1423725 RepID=A0A0R2CVH4_9LACO|nr:reverse transcriptase/maturase family protein [Liquorilactobacillus aquaticus]KRM95413.1 hypothetical protein FC19_GL002031 [Liquorilactobacillus aquaticus DSM 21051]
MFDIDKYLKKQKKYKHFDYRLANRRLFDEMKQESAVSSFRFLPYIRREFLTYRFNGKKIKKKPRNITLASHGASLVYKVYAEKLKIIYEHRIEGTLISEAATAYRSSTKTIKRSNIHAAKEVFDFISNQDVAYVIKGDFKAFFDTLNHRYLKRSLQKLFNVDHLPDDWYAVLKSLTKYEYINFEELNQLTANLSKSNEPAYFRNRKQFSKFYKKNSEKFHLNKVGIPQGTSLSALLANVYMMEFDFAISTLVQKYGGIFRRYSDDFVIVLSGKSLTLQDAKNIKDLVIHKSSDMLSLTVEKSKTDFYIFSNAHLFSLDGRSAMMDYLGFRFTGDEVFLREKSIYKFAYRGNHAIDFLIRDFNDKKMAKLSEEEIDLKSFKKPVFDEHKNIIGWIAASEYHNNVRRKQIKLVKRKLKGKIKFRISTNHKKKYLSEKPAKRTFINYVNRAQKILEDGAPNYSVLVLKQARRRVVKHQKRYHKGISNKSTE